MNTTTKIKMFAAACAMGLAAGCTAGDRAVAKSPAAAGGQAAAQQHDWTEPAVKNEVAIGALPPAVVASAQRAVPGLKITAAKKLERKAGTTYKLDGDANGKSYDLRLFADGRVIDVELDTPANPGEKDARLRPAPDAAALAALKPYELTGLMRHDAIAESSGIVASRRFPGVLWTHNDQKNLPTLFAVDAAGKLIGEFHVNATNDDWEDISIDDRGRLYVGKIGNNNAKKTQIEVLRVSEPDPKQGANGAAANVPLAVERQWKLSFPAEPFDCESLVVRGDVGYVISKHKDGSASGVYRFKLDDALGVTDAPPQVLERIATLQTSGPVTSADVSRDGRTLAVLTYGQLYFFDFAAITAGGGQGESTARTAAPSVAPRRVLKTPAGKLEGLCFTVGDDSLVITSESREVFRLPAGEVRLASGN